MSTQKETDTSTQYQFDPTTYAGRAALGADIPVWQQYIQHPFSNPIFNRMQQLGSQAAQQAGQTMMGNLLTNAPAFQMANPGGFQAQQLGQIGRAESGLQSQAIWNAIQQGLGLQSQYSGLLSGLPALQTGAHQQQIQKMVGAGSWLPSVLGGAAPFLGMIPGVGPALSAAARSYGGQAGSQQQQGGGNVIPITQPMAGTATGNTLLAPPGYTPSLYSPQEQLGGQLPLSGYGVLGSSGGGETNPFFYGGM